MTPLFILKRHSVGNTLIEYVLIGTLLAIGCIVVLLQSSNFFDSKMTGIKTDMQQHGQKAAQVQQHVQNMLALQGFMRSSGSQSGAADSQGSRATITTAGTNGDRENADTATSGDSSGDLAMEELNPAQQDAFKDLANQAHKIGQMEEQIEAASTASGGDAQKFHDMRLQYEGDQYSVYHLSSTMYSKELKNFDTLKMKLLESGALSINTLTYVNTMINQIQSRAAAVDSLTHSNDTSGIASLEASEDTNDDGKKLCKKGQRQDQGKKCE